MPPPSIPTSTFRRAEASFAFGDEHHGARAGGDDRFGRNEQHVRRGGRDEVDSREKSRTSRPAALATSTRAFTVRVAALTFRQGMRR